MWKAALHEISFNKALHSSVRICQQILTMHALPVPGLTSQEMRTRKIQNLTFSLQIRGGNRQTNMQSWQGVRGSESPEEDIKHGGQGEAEVWKASWRSWCLSFNYLGGRVHVDVLGK